MSTINGPGQRNPHQPMSADLRLVSNTTGKTLLCQVELPDKPINQVWIEPGHPKSIFQGADAVDTLHIDIRYDRDPYGGPTDYHTVIIPSYCGSIMKDIALENNIVDLRYINDLLLVARQHNLDLRGRPMETLIDIYQVPMAHALPF